MIDLLAQMQRSHGSGILFITHDLALVSEFADRILVMYAGRIVESGPHRDRDQLAEPSLHPCPDLVGSSHRRARRGAHRGPAARSPGAARGLPLPPALPRRRSEMPRRGAAGVPRLASARLPLLAVRDEERRAVLKGRESGSRTFHLVDGHDDTVLRLSDVSVYYGEKAIQGRHQRRGAGRGRRFVDPGPAALGTASWALSPAAGSRASGAASSAWPRSPVARSRSASALKRPGPRRGASAAGCPARYRSCSRTPTRA